MIRRLQITLLALFVSVWAMASETSVKNADGVEIWYDFDSNAKTASVTYRGDNYESYSDEYTGEVVIPSKVTYEGTEYSVTSIGEEAFDDCRSLTSITIPEGVTEIGKYAFIDCRSLTSIKIPESVTEIGHRTFFNCNALTSIKIPESVKTIREDAFSYCISLTSITIPERVTEIEMRAFSFCVSLTSITIPESVTSIGDNAFIDCYKLYEVYNKSNLTITAGSRDNGRVAYYAKNVYTDESGESKLHIVGDYIFYVDEDNIELLAYIGDETAITLPSDYEGKNYKIGNYAFYNCDALTSITIPEGVTEIGEWAFYRCSSLTSITLPERVTSIGSYAFNSCSSLTSITISDGVTEIGSGAFQLCNSLTSITIPEGVTEIREYAFYDCRSLTSITSMNVTPPSIGNSYTFYGVNKSIPVYVLKQSVEAYKSAEYWKDFTNIVGKFLVVTATAENGTVTGAGVYEENEEVTLIATPDEGYTFVKWEDGETNATRKITVTEDVTLTAVFESNSSVTPITDVVADSVSIRLIGNSLIVEGAESYAVYALSGQCLGKVESLERGLYIVVADGVSKKIVVK